MTQGESGQGAQACVCLVKLTEPSHILLMRIVTIALEIDADDRSRLGQPCKRTMRSV